MPEKDQPRLPPGQFETKAFPVLHAGTVPTNLTKENWNLQVYGEVGKPQTFSYEQLLKLPHTKIKTDIHCVTRWSKYDTEWEGIKFTDFLKVVQPTAKAKYVVMECEQNFTTNLPLSDLLGENVMIAFKYGGKDLEIIHGGPVRMLVPQKYFYKSAKWLRKLKFVAEDEPGYWEVRGYSNTAEPWENDRYSF